MHVEHGQEDRELDPGRGAVHDDDPAVGRGQQGVIRGIAVTLGIAEERAERGCEEGEGECCRREAGRRGGGGGEGARQYVR